MELEFIIVELYALEQEWRNVMFYQQMKIQKK